MFDWQDFVRDVRETRERNPDWAVLEISGYTGGSVEDVVEAINEIEGELF